MHNNTRRRLNTQPAAPVKQVMPEGVNKYRHNDPKPGPNDTQGLLMIIYYKNRKDKKEGHKQWYTGQKVPPQFISPTNPIKFCDKYAYDRIQEVISQRKGLWDVIIIIDKATDRRLEKYFWHKGFRKTKIYNRYRFEMISPRDLRYKIVVV